MNIITYLSAIRTTESNIHEAVYNGLDKSYPDHHEWSSTSGNPYKTKDPKSQRVLQFYRADDTPTIFIRHNRRPVNNNYHYIEMVDTVEQGQSVDIRVRFPYQSLKRRSRYPNYLTNEQLYAKWLNDAGLDVTDMIIHNAKPIETQKNVKGKPFTMATRELEVKATVRDIELFKEAYLYGKGRLRTYGCGMLRLVHTGEV